MKQIELTNQRFKETLTAFTQRKKDEGKSESHVSSVGTHAKEFLYFIEKLEIYLLENISQAHIDEYFIYLHKRKNHRRSGGLSVAYINKHREAVLRFMEFFYQTDIGKSPFTIRVIKDIQIPKDILSEQEVALLFQQCEPTFEGIRNKAILSMLYGCGLRKLELHKLNVSDINMANDTVRITQGKNSWQRDIPISPSVRENIENYLYTVRNYLEKPSKQSSAFMLTNLGVRMSVETIYLKVKQMAQRSSIEKNITPHGLRHAIATHLLGELSLQEIALFLGHKSLDSTQVYTHIKYTKSP